jgi:hypothetical protein
MKSFIACGILLLFIIGCKEKNKSSSLRKISRDTAYAWINHYSDTINVDHSGAAIIRAMYFSSGDLQVVSKGTDSVKIYTAANPASHQPALILQTVTRHSPATYEYYMFENSASAICPPPNNCIYAIELN